MHTIYHKALIYLQLNPLPYQISQQVHASVSLNQCLNSVSQNKPLLFSTSTLMYSLLPCFVGIVFEVTLRRVEEHSQDHHHVLIQLGQIPHLNDQHFVG